ncbi:DUF3108 domain-containing protein [Azospirillum thermophilum]|uniref:DUF3108 domain-containing protein n=1 Tax=Azospirillum thermophilum TaxID=2202148 RepID=UPI00143D5DF2|nr:DUF3108 domain-containing protein [Azospirillum thermophilum]
MTSLAALRTAALPGLILAAAGAPALAAPLNATYRIHVGGVSVLEAQAVLTLTDRSYDVEVRAETGGFLGRLFPWQTRSHSTGAVTGEALAPVRHTQTSLFRGKPRNVTLTYDGRGTVAAAVEPPPEEEDRPAVPEDLRRATVDPLSGVLSALVATSRGNGCTRTVPVYDGRRRYDMTMRDSGMRTVSASRYSIFAGPARECRVTYTPVAGYSPRPPTTMFWKRDDGRDGAMADDRPPVDLWIAPVVAGAPPIPVRVETDSALGAVVIHLVAINGSPTPPPAGQ